MKQSLGLIKTYGIVPAGVIALTLAAVGAAGGVGMGSDPNRTGTHDSQSDDPTVSRTVPRAEAEAAVEYWTPERMENAKPG